MDRQQLERKEIPVNARAVGTPMGMNVLYLEDYVHTFIKKLIKNDVEDNGCEVFLYGYEFDEEGKHFLIVSGACEHEDRRDIPQKMGAQYFPKESFIGTASIHSDGVSEMNMEIIKEGMKGIVLKTFYIYYDQNEEMQNYLIEWNLGHRDYHGRNEFENAVRYGRIAQAHNKEEVRVSFLWNTMNILSLGFVVCVMVYGIISINNYQKMKEMENKLSYIVTTMSENEGFIEASSFFPSSHEEEKGEEQEIYQTEITETILAEADSITEESVVEVTESTSFTESETGDIQKEEAITPNVTEVPEEVADNSTLAETITVPQYYVVQRGDTLRSICTSIYGNCDRVEEICVKNGITNPDSILYGQTLLLP